MISAPTLADAQPIARAILWRQAPLRLRLYGTTALCESLQFMVPRPPLKPPQLHAMGKTFQLSGADHAYRNYFFDEIGGEGRITLSAVEFHQKFGHYVAPGPNASRLPTMRISDA